MNTQEWPSSFSCQAKGRTEKVMAACYHRFFHTNTIRKENDNNNVLSYFSQSFLSSFFVATPPQKK
jgi:hypothetical protein